MRLSDFIQTMGTFLVLCSAAAALVVPAPVSSDQCVGEAVKDPVTGIWYMDSTVCQASQGCGSQGTTSCGIFIGGLVSASSTACGGPNDPKKSPTCCYVAVDLNSNTPFGNGLCKDSPGVREGVADHCPAGNDCNAQWVGTSQTRKKGKCSVSQPN